MFLTLRANVNTLKTMIDYYYFINSTIYPPKFTKSIALKFVAVSLSTGVWTFPLKFVFQGQAKYNRDK